MSIHKAAELRVFLLLVFSALVTGGLHEYQPCEVLQDDLKEKAYDLKSRGLIFLALSLNYLCELRP